MFDSNDQFQLPPVPLESAARAKFPNACEAKSASLIIPFQATETRVPMSALFSGHITCLHSSTVLMSRISSFLIATKTCCLLWADRNCCNTVRESVQWYTFPTMSWPSRMSCLNLTAYKAACSSNFGTVLSFMGAIPHFPITKVTSMPMSVSALRYLTTHIASKDASEKIWRSTEDGFSRKCQLSNFLSLSCCNSGA